MTHKSLAYSLILTLLILSRDLPLPSQSVRSNTGTALPSKCTVGDEYTKTNATAGMKKFICINTDVWEQQGGSGGSGFVPNGLANGSITFADGAGSLGEDHGHFYWDSFSHQLHIGPRTGYFPSSSASNMFGNSRHTLSNINGGTFGIGTGFFNEDSSSSSITGIYGGAGATHTAAPAKPVVTGGYIYAENLSSGPIDLLEGLHLSVSNNGTGQVNQLTGLNIDSSTSGTPIGVTGVHLNEISAASTAQNVGLDIGNIHGGSANYAIQTGLGQISFGDSVTATKSSVNGFAILGDLIPTAPGGVGNSAGIFGLCEFSGVGDRNADVCPGVYAEAANNATHNIGSLVGMLIDSPQFGPGATATNTYGLYVNPQTGGSNNYAIFAGVGKVHFGSLGASASLCTDTNGDLDTSTCTFTFDSLGSGTNTSASLEMGSGSSISATGSGIIDANRFNGNLTISATDGGLGINTSAATGVPRVIGGSWSVDSGIADLASSTSASLATVLSDETGSGAAVFAGAPTLTNTKINQSANGNTILLSTRATDTSPSGNYLDLKNFAGTSLFTVDVTGSMTAGSIPNARTSAVSTNTPSTIVSRDSSGNFSAGTISAALTGNASTATALNANGTNCSAGNFPLGVDANGAVENCTDYGTEAKTFTNKSIDAEATGNLITLPIKIVAVPAVCQNATAYLTASTPATNAPTPVCATGTNTQFGVAQFPDGAATISIQDHFTLPSDWTGAIDLGVKWRDSGTSTNTLVWQIQTACVGDGAIGDPSFNTASTVTDAGKAIANQFNDAAISGITATGCAAGQELFWKFFRDPSNASDTLAATAELISLTFTLRRAM